MVGLGRGLGLPSLSSFMDFGLGIEVWGASLGGWGSGIGYWAQSRGLEGFFSFGSREHQGHWCTPLPPAGLVRQNSGVQPFTCEFQIPPTKAQPGCVTCPTSCAPVAKVCKAILKVSKRPSKQGASAYPCARSSSCGQLSRTTDTKTRTRAFDTSVSTLER